ncbi:hypothetical protein DFH09DRAFT_1177912, partial [Mycena vulgaris]
YIPPDRQPSRVCYFRTREGYYFLVIISFGTGNCPAIWQQLALMTYIVDPAAFENYWENVLNEIFTGAMGLFLYGRRAFLILTALMAILVTTQFSLHVVTISLALRVLEVAVKDGRVFDPSKPSALEHLYYVLVLTQDLALVANTLTAYSTVVTDGLCHLVWGRPRKGFVIVPVLLMFRHISSPPPPATGYVTSYDEDYSDGPYHFDPRIVFSLNLLTNFRAVLGPEFMPLTQSSAIYCCGLVFQVVALSVQNSYQVCTSPSVLSTVADARPHIQIPVYLSHGLIGQLVNIVPTLMVVLVGLGHTIPTANTKTTSTSRSRIHISIPRPLRFASDEEDVECAVSDTDVRLEDISCK